MLLQDLFEKKHESKAPPAKKQKQPPEGLFSSGDAEGIASWLKKEYPGNHKAAVGAINFYINHAKHMPDDQLETLEDAKRMLASKPAAKKEK